MASAQLILIRHEVDPCTCDRGVQESGSMFLIQIVLSNNGALNSNCSTGSNVVVLLNCGSQVNTRVSYADLLLSLSLSLSLSPPPPPPPLFVFLDSYICICLSL